MILDSILWFDLSYASPDLIQDLDLDYYSCKPYPNYTGYVAIYHFNL